MCRGVGPGCNTREIADKLIDLKLELEDLDRREHELDQQRIWVQQSIKNVTDDSQNSPYPSLVFSSIMEISGFLVSPVVKTHSVLLAPGFIRRL